MREALSDEIHDAVEKVEQLEWGMRWASSLNDIGIQDYQEELPHGTKAPFPAG